MADPVIIPFEVGELQYAAYKYLKKGDKLRSHAHTKRDTHTIIVARGSLRYIDHETGELILGPGDHVDCADDVTHEVEALEDNSLAYHHRKYPSL